MVSRSWTGVKKVEVNRKHTVLTSSGVSTSDCEVRVGKDLLKESVATSKLSSLLLSHLEPLATAPRMPQLSGPRNGSEEEKAALPQRPLVKPSYSIPPHVMGRNIDNPVEDMVAHGRRLQKPRLGVRVPYRNLTSQIVTQDEIAQEILQRSLKKHPVHDTPEGGDIFFTIKLTQRLASRLTPSTNTGAAPVVTEVGPGKSTQIIQPPPLQPPSQPCILPDYSLIPQKMEPIPDQDLLAILEGDVDPNWAPEAKSSVTPSTRIEHYSHHTHTSKLDPLLEKELALKQLMEFETSPRKKKEKPQTNADKLPRKPRVRVKKEVQCSTESDGAGAAAAAAAAAQGQITYMYMDSANNNNNSRSSNTATRHVLHDVLHLSPVNKELTRKRKLPDFNSETICKKPHLVEKKKQGLIEKNSSYQINGEHNNKKTQSYIEKTRKKFIKNVKVITKTPASLQSIKVPGVLVTRCDANSRFKQSTSVAVTKTGIPTEETSQKPKKLNALGAGNKQRVDLSPKGKLVNSSYASKPKDMNVFSFYGKQDNKDTVGTSTPGTSIESMQRAITSTINLATVTSDITIAEGLPDEPYFVASPIRTYSPKKRVVKPIEASTSQVGSKVEPSSSKSRVEPSSLKSKMEPSSTKTKVHQTVTRSKIEQTLTKSKVEQKSTRSKIEQTSKVEPSPSKFKGEQSSSKIGSESVLKSPASNTPSSLKKVQVETAVEIAKRRRMREVDRLLQDEGAINFLYEIEQSESKRRSGIPDEMSDLSGNPRRIVRSSLKSIRRKKKDLLLKTRLVKNAVLRLSHASSTSSAAPISSRTKRHSEPPSLPIASSEYQSKHTSPQRKRSMDSHESLRSPPPLMPVDPPSPSQSFVYPQRLHLTAEASRIIRRHSSSSNFSSRSASPSNARLSIDTHQLANNAENKPDNQYDRTLTPASTSGILPITKQGSETRKKGIPIFIRKLETAQTYKGKRKKLAKGPETIRESTNMLKATVPNKNVDRLPEQKSKELKTVSKVQPHTSQKLIADSKKKPVVTNMVRKMNLTDKAKLKVRLSKNYQKGLKQSKSYKLKKASAESSVSKAKTSKGNNDEPVMILEDDTPDLSSCLAAAASAFAAEDKAARKASGSSVTSHTSSPCPSRESKSPTPSRPPLQKKEPRIAAPLSPNASTYSNLIKTLENESQKQRKKDGEELIKQRSSVRQYAGTFHYKEISLRRYGNLVQVILTPQSTKMKNALNLQVLRELRDVLHQLRRDDACRAVLLTSTGSSFCQGIDFHVLMHSNTERRKTAAQELAQALKDFMKCLALFNKPIVAGVQGAAVGLGVTMLPFFDMVFASDKATFYTPYAKLGQVPEGAAILTLPHMFGNAVTSELLFGCRKLTAREALHFGLVTRTLWPDRFQEELIPVIRSMANQSAQSMEATKALLRHSLRTKLDAALESESHLLVQHWCSAECQANFRRFLDDEDVGLQRQKMDA